MVIFKKWFYAELMDGCQMTVTETEQQSTGCNIGFTFSPLSLWVLPLRVGRGLCDALTITLSARSLCQLLYTL